jgi:hypothetical protein
VGNLEAALDAYAADPIGEFAAFANAVEQFSVAQWRHMNLERKVIMPAAQKHLTPGTGRRSAMRSPAMTTRVSRSTTTKSSASFCANLNLAPAAVVGGRLDSGARSVRLNRFILKKWEAACSKHKGIRYPGSAVRWRALTLAIATALAAAGSAQAFEIPLDNPDLTMRWDNTVRYNLGVRAQDQKSDIIGSPNYDDGDRNFGNGSIVTNRFDVLSEFDFVFQKKYGFRVSGAGWYDNGVPEPRQPQRRDGQHARQRPARRRRAQPLYEALREGLFRASSSTRSRSRTSTRGDVPINVKAGQHTVYWGDSLLLGGAIHGIFVRTRIRFRRVKGFATPGSEAKELFRPRGGLTIQAQPTKDLSVAGQWFYNWQADRIPESGSYLTIQDPLNFGGDSFIFSPNPLAAQIPARTEVPALWRGTDIKPAANSASLGDWGVSARWSPEWLDGTLGVYYRNGTDVLPQAHGDAGRRPGPGGRLHAARRRRAAGGTLCFVNPQATSVADLQKFGKLGLYNGAYGDDIHLLA